MNKPAGKTPAFAYSALKKSQKMGEFNNYLKGMNKNTKQRWMLVFGVLIVGAAAVATTTKSQNSGAPQVAAAPAAKTIETTPVNITSKTDSATLSNAEMNEMKVQLAEQAQVSKALLAKLTSMQNDLQATKSQMGPSTSSSLLSTPPKSNATAMDFMIPPPPEPPATLKKPPSIALAGADGAKPGAPNPAAMPLPVAGLSVVAPQEPRRTSAKSFIPEVAFDPDAQAPEQAQVDLEVNEKRGYLPAGSFTSATLLSGVEAITGGTAQSQPQPVLIRIEHDAILPNAAGYQIKGCHVLASVWGDMSSERVYGRLATLTCVDQYNKLVLSDEVEGNLVDSDGKNGIRGVLQDRQGAKLARSLLAGFATGIASAFGAAQTTATTNLAGVTTTNALTGDTALRAAGLTGASEATKKLAEFYMKQAEATMPVISVDAGRRISIMFTRSKSLKFETLEPYKVRPRTQVKSSQTIGGAAQ